MRLLLLCGIMAMGWTGVVQATPSLQVEAFDNTDGTKGMGGTRIALQNATGARFAAATGGDSNFQAVTLMASGADYASGGLSTTTLDVSANANSVLTLFITQTGLTATSDTMPFALTFTLNGLTTTDGMGAVSFADYVSPNDVAFGMKEALGQPVTISNTVGSRQLSATATRLNAGKTYSETQMVTLAFTSGGTLSASSQLKPVSVREPASLVLMAGVLGLASLFAKKGRPSGTVRQTGQRAV